MAPLVTALARLLPIIAFASFGVYFMQSNMAAGLGVALKKADVLVTAALAGLGWAVARFLSSVDKRFDTTDASLREVKSTADKRFDTTDASLREVKSTADKRFDTTDANLREVKNATDGILRDLKSILEQQRVGR